MSMKHVFVLFVVLHISALSIPASSAFAEECDSNSPRYKCVCTCSSDVLYFDRTFADLTCLSEEVSPGDRRSSFNVDPNDNCASVEDELNEQGSCYAGEYRVTCDGVEVGIFALDEGRYACELMSAPLRRICGANAKIKYLWRDPSQTSSEFE